MADDPPGMQRDALFADLSRALHGAMQSIVPRFLDTMPAAYFHDTDQATRVGHLQALIAAEASGFSQDLTDVRDGTAAVILQALGELSGQVLRSNALMPQRRALVFRLPGEALPAPGQAPPPTPEQGASSGARADAESPFGVFFVHGRDFDGVHVRFRDLARGGLRIVRPAGTEQFSLESERLYEEGYSLAWAQHLKNKDIPEGGAKGVILTAPGSAPEPAARAYVDALLDLIAPDPRTGQCLAADGASAEVLYLGPDENISAEMIDWIARRARQRGYPLPSAFISSKPGAGVNHKRYGVTSGGLGTED